MGFHKRRRNRGGGHHGHGGGHHGHGGGADRALWTGEANGLQPGDDVGNRKSFKPVIVPPDDIGNRRDPDEEEFIPADDVGNRVDANPTHELSGVLLDLDPKKRRRRPKGAAPLERIGRYIVGGVNPLVAGGNRPMPPGGPPPGFFDDVAPEGDADDGSNADARPPQKQKQHQQQQQPKKKFEHVDGAAAHEVSERRAQRFFDFDEDDRFDYTLKSPPEDKRALAERFVTDILREAGRDATVAARVLHDGDKPKLIVTIDDRGPLPSLPPERRGPGAAGPLFVMGNGALLSLNYLVNKVVNRYPDDRIRLAVLPLSDEKMYLDSLEQHRRRAVVEPASPVVASAPPPPAVPIEPVAPSVVAARPAPAAIAPPPAAPTEPVALPEPPAIAVAAAQASVVDEPPTKRPRRGRKKAEDKGDDVAAAAAAAAVTAPAVTAPAVTTPAITAPAPAASVPPVPPVPPPAITASAPAPALTTPVSSFDTAPVTAPTMAPTAAPPPAPAASAPVEDDPPKGRRRAPPLDDFPVRPSRGEGAPLPRGKVRRASTAFVEVVRVPKKP